MHPTARLVLDKWMKFFSAFGQEYGTMPIFILAIGFLPKGEVFLMFTTLTLSTMFWSA
jgi:hypothetical protein